MREVVLSTIRLDLVRSSIHGARVWTANRESVRDATFDETGHGRTNNCSSSLCGSWLVGAW